MAFTSPTYPPRAAQFVALTGNAFMTVPAGAVEWTVDASGGATVGGVRFLQPVRFSSSVAVGAAFQVATTGQERAAVYYAQ
jgi:hypothetical protein